ncbi:hypothetical protein BBJ28_00011482 [Nothophytophthora sp. Chile5]|nr:hypothetical protein BBJ28_00011482 [Nothophytophthora sp. Chile5]
MGLAIVAVIQEKTRWVASSFRKLRSKRSRKATEATELQPIALAGASKGFTGSSRQCNTFARTPSGANPESHRHWTDSSGSKAVTGEWETSAWSSTQVVAMAKSANPMEAFRREQKKKELKKHRQERQKEKQGKLAAMDAAELQDQLKNLERQVASNPTDGPTRKRKQELEDTLRAVVKKQKEVGGRKDTFIAEEERRKQAEAPPPAPLTMTELAEANKERFQNPENSVYYHPTLNPFGAPPPGKPQMYRGVVPTPGSGAMGVARGPPRGFGRPPPRQGGYPMHQQQQRPRGPPPQFREGSPRGPPRFDDRRAPPAPPRPPRAMARRPGKRPPLPPGPPPPGTIQVPPRPPLPSGAIPFRPPPPPPAQKPGDMAPPPPPPPQDLNARDEAHAPMAIEAAAESIEAEREEDSVVAPYPTADGEIQQYEDQEMDAEAAEEAAESRARLRSLVPVALRVQRRPTVGQKSNVGGPPPAPGPRRPLTVPLAPVPGPALAAVGPPLGGPPLPPSASTASDSATLTATGDNSVSKEFDAFMEEVKELL